MSCNDIQKEIPLYSYGEVSSETEEKIESHLAECTACRAELERHRSFMSVWTDAKTSLILPSLSPAVTTFEPTSYNPNKSNRSGTGRFALAFL